MKFGFLARVAMIDFVIQLAKKAGNYLKENIESDLHVHYKGRINPVTRIDKISQEIIFDEIENNFPSHAVIAEEGLNKKTGSEFTWIIDPLDGTVNYIHRIPIFCVSIAIFQKNEPYIGVCYNPMRDELFYSEKNKGAYYNGKKILVSSTSKLIDALVVTGFPYTQNKMGDSLVLFSRILENVQGVRRLGSAALDLCYVAAGYFDGFWEMGLQPWDVAAGIVIVNEAGGIVTGFNDEPFDLYKGNILAGNVKIHKELKKLI